MPACAWRQCCRRMKVCTPPWPPTWQGTPSARGSSTSSRLGQSLPLPCTPLWQRRRESGTHAPQKTPGSTGSRTKATPAEPPFFLSIFFSPSLRSASPRSISRSPARSASRSPGRSPARRLDETDESQLERLYKPVFVMKPTSVRCSEGQTARFDLKVVGRPMPDTYWFHNGRRDTPTPHSFSCL